MQIQCVQAPLGSQPEADYVNFLKPGGFPPYIHYTNADGSFNQVFELDVNGSVRLLYSGPRSANEQFHVNDSGTLVRLSGSVILGFLEDGRYLSADRENSPILCRDESGKVVFQFPIYWNWDVWMSEGPHFIYILDFQHRQLHVYDRTQWKPSGIFPLPASLLPPESGYVPAPRFQEGKLVIGGMDERYHYVNYHYCQDQIVSTETVWARPEGDFYFWRFAARGEKALLLYATSVERKGRKRPAMVCDLIDLVSLGRAEKNVFTRCFPITAQPPVGELLWIDDMHFCHAHGHRSSSEVSVYSLEHGRLFKMKIEGWISDVDTDGHNLYVLTRCLHRDKPIENLLFILKDVTSKQ